MSIRALILAAIGLSACSARGPDGVRADATAPDAALTDPASRAPDLVNVAAGGAASASATWQEDARFHPDNVIDGSSYDAAEGGNYWLLPNETAGWWQIDLNKTFEVEVVRILNCNNGGGNDRATKDFRLEIKDDSQRVVYAVSGILPFTSASSAASPTRPYEVRLDRPVPGRTVKIFVDSWYPTRSDLGWPHPVLGGDPSNQGGGLNEVEILARAPSVP